ncbi:PepSY domain-containing protein [Schnuerera sp. xch1]|uniref:YcdB/YcdC domain-containing protein n=1 Tax=Schnuerera sp. xch1 TaxID=2874283 RepID=UPI001CBF570D|nr:YcdB/YcdC domain-containing protein [Schnuerera sp. xch1]MBZ2175853.1 PepSY domain-containing protein [Schnuerera sp. xch1]
MKSRVSFLILTILFFTAFTSSTVYGENGYDEKLEQTIIKVKDIFQISDKYERFDSNIQSYDEMTYFYLNWYSEDETLGGISVTVDSEGNIFSYHKYIPFQEPESRLPKINYQQGLESAIDFLEKVNSKVQDEIQYKEDVRPLNPNTTEYTYEFIRMKDDTFYPDNSISVHINKYTGEVSNYYTDWDKNMTLPSKVGIIQESKARESYKENIGLKLMYKDTYEDGRLKHFLVYTTLKNNNAIDAKTGEAININYYDIYRGLGGGDVGMADSLTDKDDINLSPEERERVEKLSDILTSEEAENKAREILNIEDEFKLESTNFDSQLRNENDYFWSFNFVKYLENEEEIKYNVSIDAKTGELLRFYSNKSVNHNLKPKYNKKHSQKVAEEFIKQINSEKFKEIEYIASKNKDMTHSYSFKFMRKIKEAYVENDGIRVTVDGITGKVISYDMNWYKGELTSVENIIPVDEAYEILFNDIGFELRYGTLINFEDERDTEKEVKLIYAVESNKPLIIDANTGDILDYNGKPFEEGKIVKYEDIDNSYEKEKIELLAQHGVSFNSKEFKPSEKIVQKDFLYLLLKSMEPYRIIHEAEMEDEGYNRLIDLGILKEEEKDPNGIVTKVEAIKYIIRAMDYERVAELNGIYKDLFKDQENIDPVMKGYLSLGYGLNIIEGNNGYIDPTYEIKREDAAKIVYNYLFI